MAGRIARRRKPVGQDGCGRVADQVSVQVDRRQGGRHEVADKFVVVDAENGHFFGDADAASAAGLDELVGPQVVGAEDGDGLGQGSNPLLETSVVRPERKPLLANDRIVEIRNRRRRRIVDRTVEVVQLQAPGEGGTPLVGIAATVESAEGEPRELVLDEVTRGQLSDDAGVLVNGRDARPFPFVEDVDDGLACVLECSVSLMTLSIRPTLSTYICFSPLCP